MPLKKQNYSNQDDEFNDSALIVVQGFNTNGFDPSLGLCLSRFNESTPQPQSREFSFFLSPDSPDEFQRGAGLKIQSEKLCEVAKVKEVVGAPEIHRSLVVPRDNVSNSQHDLYLELSKGHLAVLTKITVPIFPQSRKISKTKRRDNHNNSFYSAIDKKMPGRKKGSSKRLDQQQHLAFGKLSPEEQEDRDQTFEDIRLLNASNDPESKAVLGAYQAKYLLSRPWALFLDYFVNSS